MAVLSEEKVLGYLGRCLKLFGALLPLLLAKGTERPSGDILEAFDSLVRDLAREREKDPYLADEAWNWIWKGKQEYTHLQLYGRLAWIHYELFQLL